MTNEFLSSKHISLLVNVFNSTSESKDGKMTKSDFDQDEGDFNFWGATLMRMYTHISFSELRESDDITIGRTHTNRGNLLHDMWEISVIMTNNIGIADEIDDSQLKALFQEDGEPANQMPDYMVAKDRIFKLANYCNNRRVRRR